MNFLKYPLFLLQYQVKDFEWLRDISQWQETDRNFRTNYQKKKKSVFTFRSLKKEKSIIFFPLSLCLGLYTAETEIDAKTGETMNMR